MRYPLLAPCVLSLLAALPAQPDMAARMQPPAEVKQLEVMVGSFAGSGTVQLAPNGEQMEWTARSTVRWALRKFAVEERTTIQFRNPDFPPLHFQSFLGYDREAKRYLMIAASEMGVIAKPGYFVSATEFVSTHAHGESGQPLVDRDVARFGKDGYEFVMTRVIGTGAPFAHVRGSFERVAEAKVDVAEAAAGKPSPELAKLARMAGTWKVTGNLVMAQDAEPMPISATETTTFVFGGNALRTHVVGDPAAGDEPGYEMYGFIGWDPWANCYVQVYADTMGMIGRSEGRLLDADRVVFTDATPFSGTPAAGRAIVEFGQDGGMKVFADRLQGAAPALRNFTATYVPAK